MMVHLVHHADAVGPDIDTQRPISARGRAAVAALALLARDAGVSPSVIWHSGKLRARQTAEAFLTTCAPFAAFSAARGLLPDDPPEWMAQALVGESADVMVVGHMPHLARLARQLAPEADEFPLHGIVSFDRAADGTHTERWRAAPPP
jgi:phosphohistidine phosphatase